MDAHCRHWKDAELLFDEGRWANADHLYGISAECGLKAILVRHGEAIAGDYREHIDRLWDEFRTFAAKRPYNKYLSQLPESDPFHDWDVGGRYANSLCFAKASVEPHRRAARGVCDMVERMDLDGAT